MAERLRFQSPKNIGSPTASCEERLAEALKARDQLLKERPSLQAYQDEIDRALQNVIGYEDRMAVLGVMMEAKLQELGNSLAALQTVTRRFDAILKAARERTEEYTGLVS
jgi:flagellar motility protein MotE (MotC chaperone)